MASVQFRGSRAELSGVIEQLQAVLAGDAPDRHGIAKGFFGAIGLAALSDVKDAFVIKAKGGTDELGIKWKPLAPSTIANRRVGPRDRKDPAIALREKIRKRETKKALARYRLSLPEEEAQRRSKIVGGIKATQLTGKTKIQTLGSRDVEILRDTGVLLNSLSPGRWTQSGYTKPTTEGGDEQIFEIEPGEVIVGTNVEYASVHQNGSANIPARPFLPEKEIPTIWWNRWIKVANKALSVALRRLISER